MMKNRQSHLERIKLLIENKKTTEIFKRKVKVIKRHFNNSQHPLRMLTDLFGDELQRIQDTDHKTNSSDMNSSRAPAEDLTRSMMKNTSNMRSQIKLSDREKESENLNLKKQKKFKRMTDMVKDFITLLKFAIVRFYQIDYNKLTLFQKNHLTEKVKSIVLGLKVSKILHYSAQEAFRDEIMDFSKAIQAQ